MEFYILILFSKFSSPFRDMFGEDSTIGAAVNAHTFDVVTTRSDGELTKMEGLIVRRLADPALHSIVGTAKAIRKNYHVLPRRIWEHADSISLFQFDDDEGRDLSFFSCKNRSDILIPETVREALSKFAPIYGGKIE